MSTTSADITAPLEQLEGPLARPLLHASDGLVGQKRPGETESPPHRR